MCEKSTMSKKFPGGVITGDGVQAIFNDAQENEYALPAVNVVQELIPLMLLLRLQRN